MELCEIKGLGKARLHILKKAGVYTIEHLLLTFPDYYRDTTRVTPVNQITDGQYVCVCGCLKGRPRLSRFNGITMVKAVLRDDTGVIDLVWFNQPWAANVKDHEAELLIYGRVERKNGRLRMVCPIAVTERCLSPVYRRLQGIPGKVLCTIMRQALEQADACCPENLPETLRSRHNLCGRRFALVQMHFPDNTERLAIAKRRLAFEHLLLYQAALSLQRHPLGHGVKALSTPSSLADYWQSLPFKPTEAQVRVLKAIADDLAGEMPMRRLVQGDVGSGKTAVAMGAISIAAGSGFQTALMAPTEILARQHFETAVKILAPRGITYGLLTGSMHAKERKEALEKIANGSWQAVIGTHALLSRCVIYKNLGLVITDEQHRFGVRQRRQLAEKAIDGPLPNVLVMSATPIPRTLALILYGDLDISVINELPPGRMPVITRIVPESKREAMYRFLIEKARNGQQAYIVCPLVSENEDSDLFSAKEMYAELVNGPLRSIRAGLTYGTQNRREKESTIGAFARGDIDVLISTTVIEVGVNVPNATVMIIENADRFGLSQLHQLRGRVGRGGMQSWCFLLSAPNERLDVLCRTDDGFEIAQKDLELRGPGEILGTRQHGMGMTGMPGNAPDAKMLEETQKCIRLLEHDIRFADEYRQVLSAAEKVYEKLLENATMD